METLSHRKNKTLNLPDGIIIAAVPAFAYISAFLYELAYAQYFRFPVELISIELTQVLFLVALFFGFAITIFSVFRVLWLFVPRPEDSDRISQQLQSRILSYLIVSVIAIIFFSVLRTSLISVLISMIVFAIIWFGSPLLLRKKGASYTEMLQAQNEAETVYDERSMEGCIKRLIGPWIFYLLLLLLFLMAMAYFTGLGQARSQTEFFTINTTPELVVLRIYNDRIISSEFDRDLKVVHHSYTIFDILDMPDLNLTLEDLGPLEPE